MLVFFISFLSIVSYFIALINSSTEFTAIVTDGIATSEITMKVKVQHNIHYSEESKLISLRY